MTIWKFPLLTITPQSIMMPKGAQILSCQMQGVVPCLWAIVDPDAALEARTVHIIGTGHRVPMSLQFVSTIQMAGGSLILHIFVEAP